MRLIGLMACDEKGVIGNQGKLPWYCPKDVEHFLETTNGQVVIMGRKTYDSTPESFFPGRDHYILTRSPCSSEVANIHFIASFDEMPQFEDKTCYIIGGSETIRFCIENNLLDSILLSRIHGTYNGDVFFPLELIEGWPKERVREEKGFTLYRYINPLTPDCALISHDSFFRRFRYELTCRSAAL